jgi:SAM-dependent methyltransferase
VRCRSCGFHFVNPVPDAETLSRFYDDSYVARHAETWHGGEDGLNRGVIRRLRSLGVQSLVDLGAGQGRFVRMARDHGIEAIGVEAGSANCRVARERYDVALVETSLEEYVAQARSGWECVTMLNVLEHIPRPLPVLRRIAELLRPGGVLLLVVPNVSFTLTLGWLRRLLGFSDIYMLESTRFSQQGFDPPIHMCSFDAPHLRDALARVGLVVECVTQAPVIASSKLAMRVAKRSVQWAAQLLERVTAGRAVLGYSLLAVARRGELAPR